MEGFIQRHQQDVTGVLSGFDRLLFRGTLRSIAYGQGLDKFLGGVGVRYKDFGSFKLCGSGEYPRTVLTKGMQAFGQSIE